MHLATSTGRPWWKTVIHAQSTTIWLVTWNRSMRTSRWERGQRSILLKRLEVKSMYILDFIWRIKLENWSKRTRSWIEKCEWSFNDKLKLPVNRKIFEPSFVPSIIYSFFFIGKGYRIYKKETFMADLTLEIRLKLLRLVWI